MAPIFSVILILLGIMEICLGLLVYAHDGRQTRQNNLFFLTCMTGFIWAVGRGVMMVAPTDQFAYVFRAIGLAGSLTYCCHLVNYILSITGNPFRTKKVIPVYILVGSIFCLLLLLFPTKVIYIETNIGKECYSNDHWIWVIQLVYFLSLIFIWLYSVIKWMNSNPYRREIQQGRIMLVALVFFVTGILWDSGATFMKKSSYEAGAVLSFVTVCILYQVLRKYNSFQITDGKMSGYIYNKVNTPVMLLYSDYSVADCNESACRLLQEKKENLVFRDIFSFLKEESVAERQKVRAQIANKESEFTLNVVTMATGSICTVDGSVLYDKYRDVLCIICMFHDVTQMRKVMDELEASRQEAAKANEAKTAFLSNMSHEIRTPLNSIIGMCDILSYKDLSDDIQSDVNVIQTAGKGLLNVINDILDISKIESGKVEIQERTYDMKSLLEEIVNMIAVRTLEKKIKFLTVINPNLPRKLIGDGGRVRQVLINILSNAVKYTNEGYIILDIDYELVFGKITLIIKVSDTGIGIRPEDKEKIFGSFNQVDTIKNRNIVGTGLGLTICRNIARILGGDVTVESTYGEGSVFTIRLNQRVEDEQPMVPYMKYKNPILLMEIDPKARELHAKILDALHVPYYLAANSMEAEQLLLETRIPTLYVQSGYASEFESRLTVFQITDYAQYINEGKRSNCICDTLFPFYIGDTLANKTQPDTILEEEKETQQQLRTDAKILVVDDSKTNQRVIMGLLKRYEVKVIVVSSGKEAIEKIQTEHFDLVLMDQMMPEMDGVQTTHYIRTQLNMDEKMLPIVLLTANRIQDIENELADKGFNAFMEKPVNTELLDTLIRIYLIMK